MNEDKQNGSSAGIGGAVMMVDMLETLQINVMNLCGQETPTSRANQRRKMTDTV
jgi:hypothetical protein